MIEKQQPASFITYNAKQRKGETISAHSERT